MNKKYHISKNHPDNSLLFLYGHHAVNSALNNHDRQKTRLFLLENTKLPDFIPTGLPTFKINKEAMEKLLPTAAIHQGIAMEVKPLEPLNIDDILRQTSNKDKSIMVILDGVTDPHNIGAILRSMAAFNADALLVQDKHSPGETAAMAKSASGALDIVPIVRLTNLARAIEQLKQNGYWIVGMDGKADKTLTEQNLPNKIAIILGSEGEGMRRLTIESCDFLAKLPISNKMESLNVSAAAAITLYELAKQSDLPSGHV